MLNITLNTPFLTAVAEFADGGDGADLLDVMQKLSVTHEEMSAMLTALGDKDIPPSLDAETFANRLAARIDTYTLDAASSDSIAPIFNDETRGDNGVYVRRRAELGMQHTDPEQPEKSDTSHLYEALRQNGWVAFTSLCKSKKISVPATRTKIFGLAELHSLTDEIIQYKRRRTQYTMIGPQLSEIVRETFQEKPVLEGMQPGERVISNLSRYKLFQPLFAAIQNELELKGFSPDLALITRKSRRNSNAKCITPALLNILEQLDAIILPENINQLIPSRYGKLPNGIEDTQILARTICMQRIALQSQQEVESESSKWTDRTSNESQDFQRG